MIIIYHCEILLYHQRDSNTWIKHLSVEFVFILLFSLSETFEFHWWYYLQMGQLCVCVCVCVWERERQREREKEEEERLEQRRAGIYCYLSTCNNISIRFLSTTMFQAHSCYSQPVEEKTEAQLACGGAGMWMWTRLTPESVLSPHFFLWTLPVHEF